MNNTPETLGSRMAGDQEKHKMSLNISEKRTYLIGGLVIIILELAVILVLLAYLMITR